MKNSNLGVKICRSQLDPNSVLSIVKNSYSLLFDNCFLIQSREHDVYLLTTTSAKAIFKIYAYNRINTDRILVLDKLLTIANSSETILDTNTYNKYITVAFPEGNRHAILLKYFAGKEVDCRDRDQAIAYGTALAILHKKVCNFFSYHFDTYKFKNIISNAQLSNQTINKLLEIFYYCTAYSLENFSSREIGLCHGDCHGGNAIYNNAATFIDFDFANIGPVVSDLCILKWVMIGNLGLGDIQINNILEGYMSEREIPKCSQENFYYFLLRKELNSLIGHINRQKTAGTTHINDQFIMRRLQLFSPEMVEKYSKHTIFVR